MPRRSDPKALDAPAPAASSTESPGRGLGALRRELRRPDGFAIVVELVPWAGQLADPKSQKPMRTAADLAGNPRVTALSITDNAGGHARLSPDVPGELVRDQGHDVIVHVACRDRNRNAIQSLGWQLLSRRLTTILAITGDYPVEGYGGLARPVFDIDSVALLAMLRELGDTAPAGPPPADGETAPAAEGFFLGCAIDPTKRLERDLVPQLLKLALKRRAGADYAITQVGYDARRLATLRRWMDREAIDLPVIANAYILSAPVARAFNAGKVPGCVVTDDLLALVEREAASPDKGRAFFLEFAAKQLVVARGLGYRGLYLSGHRDAGEIARILELADAHDPADWRSLVPDVSWSLPGSFELFAADADGIATDELSPTYARSLLPSARDRARARVTPVYKVNRLLHERVFEPGSPGFATWTGIYQRVEQWKLEKPLHLLEQAAKVPLFDCRDCGDCSLPDIAYLCPESHCQKNQRNGPCGGAHDGQCEVPGHTCIWADAYTRLKPYGEERTMLERAPVIPDNALRRTSAWANTFLGRDHYGRSAAADAALDAPAPVAAPQQGPHA